MRAQERKKRGEPRVLLQLNPCWPDRVLERAGCRMCEAVVVRHVTFGKQRRGPSGQRAGGREENAEAFACGIGEKPKRHGCDRLRLLGRVLADEKLNVRPWCGAAGRGGAARFWDSQRVHE